MNQLKVFGFKQNEVRTILKDGEPWFVAKDVCEILEITNPTMALQRLDDDERAKFNLGRQGETNIVNEPGLYTLILGSRKPEAKEFKRWITHEVIPAIRKTGSYSIMDSYAIDDPIERAKRWIEEEQERQKLKTENLVLTQQVNELQPKASYYDLILQNKSLLSITKIAKDYGMSGMALNKKLHELGVQYKQGDIWLLYAKYQDKGYTQTTTHVIDADKARVSTKWTQKGRLFIYELLKNEGILPIIERDQEGEAS
ncbi:phage antirepressor [Parvimonas micra]|uniref:BRO family, N-terminal domain protein n=1 Tax=Parvimonas micra ATCC 33270 TaxID=411465 RepID=A8SI87_9FIRM|nr:phage antirepressor [Parvimonas micra]EDP24819.1 BRO family, N-terminal domain protein [Parvimonas micra ATCC 33270]